MLFPSTYTQHSEFVAIYSKLLVLILEWIYLLTKSEVRTLGIYDLALA